jgi:hypothetical protein
MLRQQTRFRADGEKLLMTTTAVLLEVGRFKNTGSDSTAGLLGTETVGSPETVGVYSVMLHPTTPVAFRDTASSQDPAYLDGWYSPIWDLIASAFTRYKVKKLCFHYRPQSTATSTDRFIFAFAPDPAHPLLASSYTTAANAAPTDADLLACADSVPFAPWVEWSLDVTRSLDQDYLHYVDNMIGEGTGITSGIDPAQARTIGFGVISCVCSTGGSGATLPYGVLYMESEIEFSEFCPVSLLAGGPVLRLGKIAEREARRKRRREHKPPELTLGDKPTLHGSLETGLAKLKVDTSPPHPFMPKGKECECSRCQPGV